jgi:hypothetical protein
VDVVAHAVLDLAQINKQSSSPSELSPEITDGSIVYHVQNLLPALHDAGLEFEIVPQREWVKRLSLSEKDPEKNPTIKLLDFFAEKYDNDRPGRKGLVFVTDKTAEKSEAIRDGYDVVKSGLVKKFVHSWRLEW